MSFSERYGHTPVRSQIQKDGMDDALKNGLWNVFNETYWSMTKTYYRGSYQKGDYLPSLDRLSSIAKILWEDFFKQPTDTIPSRVEHFLRAVRDFYFSAKWYQIYDFVEFMATCEKKITVSIGSLRVLRTSFLVCSYPNVTRYSSVSYRRIALSPNK